MANISSIAYVFIFALAIFFWPFLIFPSFLAIPAILLNTFILVLVSKECSSDELPFPTGLSTVAAAYSSGCANITIVYIFPVLLAYYVGSIFWTISSLIKKDNSAKVKWLHLYTQICKIEITNEMDDHTQLKYGLSLFATKPTFEIGPILLFASFAILSVYALDRFDTRHLPNNDSEKRITSKPSDVAPKKAISERRSNGSEESTPLEDLFSMLKNNVVFILSKDRNGNVSSTGSGILLLDGVVITNAHVIKDAASITILHEKQVATSVLNYLSESYDLAIFSTTLESKFEIKFTDFDELKVGQKVVAIGNPKGLELTFSDGIISSLRRINGYSLIQTTAAISPGSSGGGLFDLKGNLVGVTTAYINDGQNLNFAISTNDIKEFFREVTEKYRNGEIK